MEIIAVNFEKNRDRAIRYVYEHAMSSKISYHDFKTTILNDSDESFGFYVLKNDGVYIGYLLLLADSLDEVPKPFSFLACHNGDELSYEQHCKLLEFAIKIAKEKGFIKLEHLMKDELFEIQSRLF